MKKAFHITNLGEVHYYLRVQIERDAEGIFYLSQSTYIEKLLHKFNLQDSKASKIPLDIGYEKIKSESPYFVQNTKYQSLIGALMYLSTFTRPDVYCKRGNIE